MTGSSVSLREAAKAIADAEQIIAQGGGEKAIARQHAKNRRTAHERVNALLDSDAPRLDLGVWAGFEMYDEYGGAPAAGVLTLLGEIKGRQVMVIANDATVKAGAFFPATAKKVLRAQRIAMQNRLPLVYLVDSAGVFLPLQEDVFPDEDDFGRIFRNNAVISAAGIPQLAAIMGNCVAGGGYLPVLCDKLIMTEGSGLYLAGPALVKSAIGQEISSEDLGGAAMHAGVSGTIDFREPDDAACIARIQSLVEATFPANDSPRPPFRRLPSRQPEADANRLLDIAGNDNAAGYDVRELLKCIVDADSFQEYKPEFGQSIVCGVAHIDGYPVGVVANQQQRVTDARGGYQFGKVIYVDSAEKAARFVLNCNQDWLPILFLQNVNGFMVGRDSEQAGIIKAGAKLVSAVSNSRVPKLTVITGGSFGAGNYAMCGKAFDPRLIVAWPTAEIAVMGSSQATKTLLDVTVASLRRKGEAVDDLAELQQTISADYDRQTDIRYAAARGWVDAIIQPADTRLILSHALRIATQAPAEDPFRLGVFQV